MKVSMRLVIVFIISLFVFMSPVQAAKRPQDKAITNSMTFIKQHPDLLYRLRGLEHYKKAEYSEAFFNFKLAKNNNEIKFPFSQLRRKP